MASWRGGVVAVILAGALACGESTGPELGPDESLLQTPREVTLRVGEEVQVEGSVLRVGFVRVVEDSRCPVEDLVLCVWEGNAVVEVGARAGMGPTVPLQLNTSLEPRSREWSGVRLSIVRLLPIPRLDRPTPPEAYELTLRLEPAG